MILSLLMQLHFGGRPPARVRELIVNQISSTMPRVAKIV
jgi:hypothetical protein